MLKRYYGLSEAAEFLSAEHKRQISVSDVMEMAARREIRLCLWCDGVLGIFEYQEIGVSTRFLGPPYSFCGYIGVPARSIAPRGGLPRFDQVFVVEEIHPPESKMPQLPHVDYPQFVGFIGDHESILNMGANGVRSALLNCTLLPVPFTPNIDEMVVPAADLLALSPDNPAQSSKPGASVGGDHVSRELETLNQAAHRFWANADPEDRGTHPENKDVAAWLIDKGFSATRATKAASIIRPEWAPVGRKPDE